MSYGVDNPAKNKALDGFEGRGKERPGRAGTEQMVVEGMEGVEGFTGKECDLYLGCIFSREAWLKWGNRM